MPSLYLTNCGSNYIQIEIYKELYSPEESMQKSINWLRSHKSTQADNNLFDYHAEDSVIYDAFH